jgi:putative transposase
MQPISYARHQFPAEIIRHAVWLYLRFTLSYRDVEELLAERGIEASYETVRRWVLKFGPAFARNLRRLRPRPTDRWHLDEMVVAIQGRRIYLWRAVDSEGEVLGRCHGNRSEVTKVWMAGSLRPQPWLSAMQGSPRLGTSGACGGR